MTRNRTFIVATTVVIVFFMTFLGMRITFLDKSPKPKPRPRAVLNNVTKSASGLICSAKEDLVPDFNFLHETSGYNIPVIIFSNTPFTQNADQFTSHHVSLLQGRSPPPS